MKRRNFLATSALGIGAPIIGTSANALSVDENSSSDFSISELAQKPPLGWNSFDSYGVYLHQDAAMENLEAFAKKLKPYGYKYFVIDLGWFGEYKLVEGTNLPNEKHATVLNINEYGILQPSKTYFSRGLRPIVERAHQLGIKMGIHLMRGIPRIAVEKNLPIKNSKYTAAEIADKVSTCAWNQQNFGVKTSHPGAQDWYNSVYQQIADWGFDFVKVDDLTPYPEDIVLIANAIKNSGRKMVYSLSPGGGVYMPDLPYYREANMLRITVDIWDRREDLEKGFAAWKKFQGIATPGFWPDLDMIPFGQLQLMSPENVANRNSDARLAGHGYKRWCQLSKAQMRTFITMRALAASPLMVGGNLPTLDDYSLELLTNSEMLACNQNGQCGINVYQNEGIEVWLTGKTNKPNNGWLGIFNRTESAKSVKLSRENLGLLQFTVGYKLVPNSKNFKMLDVWNNRNIQFKNNYLELELKAEDVAFLKFVAQ